MTCIFETYFDLSYTGTFTCIYSAFGWDIASGSITYSHCTIATTHQYVDCNWATDEARSLIIQVHMVNADFEGTAT